MVTGVIIAKNEASNLPGCIPTLKFCSEILVIDNNSTDETAKVAKKLGARVLKIDLKDDYSALRNLALQHVHTPWTVFVDADEQVSPDLADEIVKAIQDINFQGFYLKRRDFIWGQPLRFGDTGRVQLLRLGRTSYKTWKGLVHETWQIPDPIGSLLNPLIHNPHPDLVSFLTKLNSYSDIRAKELAYQNVSAGLVSIVLYPIAKFLHLWIFKLGFLDGTVGLIHAMSMAFYSFLVRGKLYFLSTKHT